MRVFDNPATPAPQVQLLSNGRYHVVVSNAGGGYSRWRDLAITRWREDVTRDCWGFFIYLRELDTREYWSATFQPVLRPTELYEVHFGPASAKFRQRLNDLEIHTEIWVSAEDDVEFRRVKLTNHSRHQRSIELTSYAEVVLASPWADLAHPVFSNLFVQTEFVPANPALLCTRRPRAEEDKRSWLLHLVTSSENAQLSYETDRARFVGRGRTSADPAGMQTELSNTTGSVLDPIVALRRTAVVGTGETVQIDFALGATDNRETALSLIAKYHTAGVIDRSLELAQSQAEADLREIGITETEFFSELAGALVYADPARRASSAVLIQNRQGQSGLWRHGISGDHPIVLLRMTDKIEIANRLSRAHAYWRRKGLVADLVIVVESTSASRQLLYNEIVGLVANGSEPEVLDKSGGIFVLDLHEAAGEDRVLLESAARIVLSDQDEGTREQGSLETRFQLRRGYVGRAGASANSEFGWADSSDVASAKSEAHSHRDADGELSSPGELSFYNGLGGFTADGREYVITLQPDQTTPVPWVNVLANPGFGTVISESGSAYTWAENSHELRLTPWNNDPVTDATGEAFYIRDDESGYFWSPTPLPVRGKTPYLIRHGFGYSVFEYAENGIHSELTVYVAIDAPMKFAVLKLRNTSGRARRISVIGYWEWVLGDLRQRSGFHIQTEIDAKTGAFLARNPYNTDFSQWIAFTDVDKTERSFTGDRVEFLGRNGTLRNPVALRQQRFSRRTGAGLDPCAGIQTAVELPDGAEEDVCFRFGAGRDISEVQDLVERYRGAKAAESALNGVRAYWGRTLGAVQVETPDTSANLLANGWLFYQTLSCRLWGRTGFYQSGGAFGFRDQLQDVMALVHAEPGLVREHLVRAAAHQFGEGDVLHWWHPPAGRGVRTHTSDDYLWLPYVACRYVSSVGDTSILDERIPFLEGRALKPEEESYYDAPKRSSATATFYEHCVRAVEHGLRFGLHGLPLIGSCDWNDGMNLVGREGKGESVWLAFFLYDVLLRFAELARGRKDVAFADRCLEQARRVQTNVEQHWDGQWYRRAYFDNGEPLGSRLNTECQIDSLPQSWSVISGAGDPQRARQAMESVNERLVRRDAGLIQLFDPPFDRAPLNPGYIKGYVPGVRENGGQYTHAAIWTVIAFALLGENDRAWELVELLNPINHGTTATQIATYKVEPYVVAADVYWVAPHTGRGGWTWYTGSAGWMYRLLIETLLGLNREGNQLRLMPRLPKNWSGCKLRYRYRETLYHIDISKPAGFTGPDQILLDSQTLAGNIVPLVDDRRDHRVDMRLSEVGVRSS
jgi:cyclic beta-1,2-glucan glucanotransferase